MSENRPDIDSFIIRFIQSENADNAARVRGSIRHLQTSEERAFSHWQEVEAFIQQFIPAEWIRLTPQDIPEE